MNWLNRKTNPQASSSSISAPQLPPKLPKDYVDDILKTEQFSEFITLSLKCAGVPGFFAGDTMLIGGKIMGFLKDQKFMQAFKRAFDRYENPALHHVLTQLIWRKHVLASAAKNCLALEGDYVECGVELGFGVDVVSDYIDFKNTSKTWWLYDTFAGVPTEQLDKGTRPNPAMVDPSQYQKVCDKFKDQPRFHIIQGMVPDSFIKGMPDQIAYLHIDMNNTKAEIGALIALLDRVVIGGHIILDDYGWVAFQSQHHAENLFFNALGLNVIELPTGQGLFVKTKKTNTAHLNADEIIKQAETIEINCLAYPPQ